MAPVGTGVTTTNPAKTTPVKASIQEPFTVREPREAGRPLLQNQGRKRLRPTKQPGDPPRADAQRALVPRDETMPAAGAPGTGWLCGEAMPLGHQHEPGEWCGDPKAPPGITTPRGRHRLHRRGA
jgi:hypothetical protein